jgi:hypothetical protein
MEITLLIAGILLLVALPAWPAWLAVKAEVSGVMARPHEVPLDLGGFFASDVDVLRLNPAAARLVELERARLKPRPFAPW